MIENDIYFMNQALACAKQAYEQGEVPVGAVITAGGRIICGAFNPARNQKKCAAARGKRRHIQGL